MSRRIQKPDGSYYQNYDDSEGFTTAASSVKIDLTQSVRVYSSGALVQSQITPSSTTVARSKAGEQVPMWRKLIASNNDATGFFSGNVLWLRPGGIQVGVNWNSWGESLKTDYVGPSNVGTVDTSLATADDADQLARIKFYNRLRDAMQDMSGGPFLGELGKTIRDIRRPAKALSDMADNFVRRETLRQIAERQRIAGYGPAAWNAGGKKPAKPLSKRAKKALKDSSKAAADAWLGFSFGALPLVNDIDGGARALASLAGRTDRRTVIGWGESEGSRSTYSDRVLGWQSGYVRPLYWAAHIEDTKQQVVIYRAGLKPQLALDTPLDHMIYLGGRFGLSPGELVSTAYELTPWSFLIDYFSTLGSLVNAAAVSTNDVAWWNKTVRTIVQRRVTGTINYAATLAGYPAKTVSGIAGDIYPSTSFSKTVLRSKISGVPLPRLEVRWKPSPMKLANIAALLRGFL